MSIADVFLHFFWVLFVGLFLLVVFLPTSRKVRNAYISVFLGRIQEDYGNIGATDVNGAKESLRVLKCKRGDKEFFVVESAILSKVQYIKVSESSATKLVDVLRANTGVE
jgi:hypothetical protein